MMSEPQLGGPHHSQAPSGWSLGDLLTLAVVLLLTLVVVWPSLGRDEIDGLDQAHHLMDSIFFADALKEWRGSSPVAYVMDYYRQYPALGFTIWPPLFPAVVGTAMTVSGTTVATARTVLTLFALGLVLLSFLLLRETRGRLAAGLGAGLLISTASIADLANTLMLEVPALAVALLTVWLVRGLIQRGVWRSWLEVATVAAAAAAVVYTKQTLAFAGLAVLIWAWLSRPQLIRQPRTWIALGLAAALCLPLVAFTLAYGGANLSQSLGSQGDIYGDHSGEEDLERGSLADLSYYLRQAPAQVGITLLALSIVGCGLVLIKPELRIQYGLWVPWLVFGLIQFTIFANKQPRYFVPLIPAFVFLAVVPASASAGLRKSMRVFAIALLSIILGWQTYAATNVRPQGWTGMRGILTELVYQEPPGNIVYVGRYRQLFAPRLRQVDQDRSIHLLQGDDIVSVAGSLKAACHDYQARWVLVDAMAWSDSGLALFLADLEDPTFALVKQDSIRIGSRAVGVNVYEHLGPKADTMREIPLRSAVQGIEYGGEE